MDLQPEPEGLRVARAVSQWEIGDPSWANVILEAYLNPELAMKQLHEEKGTENE